jgi:hypothetical protein
MRRRKGESSVKRKEIALQTKLAITANCARTDVFISLATPWRNRKGNRKRSVETYNLRCVLHGIKTNTQIFGMLNGFAIDIDRLSFHFTAVKSNYWSDVPIFGPPRKEICELERYVSVD